MRTIKPASESDKEKSLDLVEQVFSDFYNPQEGRMVRDLVEEIRSKNTISPNLT